ncbi:hypothetical protein M758_2G038800 [Ceratodon purpureus]|nr:hypothetical protein M758_2G038800 [Ceratodon purpureus]
MKFGRLLLQLLEQMPVEYRDKFLSYKQLKKVINTILKDSSLPVAAFVEVPEDGERATVEVVTAGDVEVAWPVGKGVSVERAWKRARGEDGVGVVLGEDGAGGEGEGEGGGVAVGGKRKAGGEAGGNNVATVPVQGEVVAVRAVGGEEKELSKEEEDFLHLLNVELEKFNHFFTEKEEDYVIRLQELKQRLERLRQQHGTYVYQSDWNEDLMTIRTGLVTLHGEVVLMESYSTLNYTGLVKILKKHDKRTGAVLRLPFIRRVLLQPFFSTELLSQLVQECEKLLSTFPPPPIQESIDVELAAGAGEAQSEPQDLSYPTDNAAGGIFKSTVAALRTIQEMRKKSSTVSAQSLPPCNLNGNDERYGIVVDEGQMVSWSVKFTEHSKNQEPETMACAS